MSDDTISRQAAKDVIANMEAVGYSPYATIGRLDALLALNRLPSAEWHGKWVDVEPAPHNLFYATCSVCGDRQTIEVANYCPMCGASMDEVEE